jgi:hypothetical protein
VHSGAHTTCVWCDQKEKAKPKPKQAAGKWVDFTAARGKPRVPKAAAEQPWTEVVRKRGRFVRGADLSVAEVQAGRASASATVASPWAPLAAADGDEGEDAEAGSVAFQGPTPAEAAREVRGQQRQAAQSMLASVRTLPVNDVTQSHIDTLHATLTELDHAAHAAKSPWERRKSLGNRVAKGKALVAKATVERDAAKLRREAAVRAHADSEQALRDAEHSLAGVIDDWDKVQSEVQAEAAEEGGNDMEAERTLASTDIASWSLEDLERLAPQFAVCISAARAERAASLLPMRLEMFTPVHSPDRRRQRPTSGTPELVSDSPGMAHSPRNRRSSRRRSASCSPPRGAASGVAPLVTPYWGGSRPRCRA